MGKTVDSPESPYLAAVRFLSVEPLLEAVNLEPFLQYPPLTENYKMTTGLSEYRGPDWVIVGGESGPGARPCDVESIRSIVKQCQSAGVPVFVKQLGKSPVQKCDQCGRMMGHCFGGAVQACGPTHAMIASELMRIRDTKGGDITEWPKDLQIRQIPGLSVDRKAAV